MLWRTRQLLPEIGIVRFIRARPNIGVSGNRLQTGRKPSRQIDLDTLAALPTGSNRLPKAVDVRDDDIETLDVKGSKRQQRAVAKKFLPHAELNLPDLIRFEHIAINVEGEVRCETFAPITEDDCLI